MRVLGVVREKRDREGRGAKRKKKNSAIEEKSDTKEEKRERKAFGSSGICC